MGLGIDLNIVSRGVLALERIAVALERLAGDADRLDQRDADRRKHEIDIEESLGVHVFEGH